jgi:hypothetical protein
VRELEKKFSGKVGSCDLEYNGWIMYTFQQSRHEVLLIGAWCRSCFWMSLKQTLHCLSSFK